MLRSFLLMVFLLLGSFSYSQENQSSTWLWQISGGELQGKSYVFGTMPLQDSTYFQFDPKLWKNLSKADVFISFDQEMNASQKKVYSSVAKEYGVTPKDYIKQLVEFEFKPIVSLNSTNSLSTLVDKEVSPNASLDDLRELEETYLSADHSNFVALRTQLDIPEAIYTSLGKKHNYLILNELVGQMQLQPVFVAIDPIYLTGAEGLINLFRARGYQVKSLSKKFYANNAEAIAFAKEQQRLWEQQNTQNTQPVSTNPGSENPTQPITAPTSVTRSVNLDLPIGILNLDQWSSYDIQDPKISYDAPIRLKQNDDNRPSRYQAIYGDLEYQIDIVDPWQNTNAQVDQIIIQNGGQVVVNEPFKTDLMSGKHIELMYTDNQISRHVLIAGLQKNLVLTVKGKTPIIHTVLADHFFNHVSIEQLPENSTLPINTIDPGQPTAIVQWSYQSLRDVQFLFPSDFIKEEAKLEGGETISAYISSRKVDNNTFALITSDSEAFDAFQLFNTSINLAASEIRGVIVESNVLPVGRPNFAEYKIKDAVDRYYRIQYYYSNGIFYQAIVKGDKKSVDNVNANQFLSSLFTP